MKTVRTGRVKNALSRAGTLIWHLLERRRSGMPASSSGGADGGLGSGLWIDAPDAESRIADAPVSDSAKRIAMAIRNEGLAVVRQAHDPETCRRVIEDYTRYIAENASYAAQHLDALGREKRLVNFHLWSDAAARIGTASTVMHLLDFVFGREAAVYTSLTFRYGTQQPVHRDTPHFATWPHNLFVGVWTALEDVKADAGPLFYHPGAHRFAVDPGVFAEQARQRLPDASVEDQLGLALDLYNGEIIRTAPQIAPPVEVLLAAGDTVIWHPELPHGGLPALDTGRTRWSLVFHCAPADVQVHQHDRFFTHRRDTPPPARYVYRSAHGRQIAQAGGVAFM